jgi:mono/diheme cytochrome c family protein
MSFAARCLGALVLAATVCTAGRAQSPASDLLARGEYLTRAADCASCHTTPGGKQYAGGRAFKLPFGTLYSPNITPDRVTGIGTWSDDEFVRALHEGIGKGGEHLYPAFPYPSYTLLSRDDVLAIKAYLFSLKPVANAAPDSELKFPFNQRWLMVFWNLLYNPDHRFRPDETRPPEWNRGAYLVEALGHCGDCHTPRNFLQGPKSGAKFAGAIVEGWRAYNITPDRSSGIGEWTNSEVADYLATGISHRHGAASGPMAEAVENGLRFLTRPDVEAMAVFLRTVAPVVDRDVPGAGQRLPPSGTPFPDRQELAREGGDPGLRLFAGNCTGCHGWTGTWLAGARAVSDPRAINLMQVLLNGTHLRSAAGELFMPEFGRAYSDAELAAVANYVTGRFGGRAANLTPDEVQKRRQGP